MRKKCGPEKEKKPTVGECLSIDGWDMDGVHGEETGVHAPGSQAILFLADLCGLLSFSTCHNTLFPPGCQRKHYGDVPWGQECSGDFPPVSGIYSIPPPLVRSSSKKGVKKKPRGQVMRRECSGKERRGREKEQRRREAKEEGMKQEG